MSDPVRELEGLLRILARHCALDLRAIAEDDELESGGVQLTKPADDALAPPVSPNHQGLSSARAAINYQGLSSARAAINHQGLSSARAAINLPGKPGAREAMCHGRHGPGAICASEAMG